MRYLAILFTRFLCDVHPFNTVLRFAIFALNFFSIDFMQSVFLTDDALWQGVLLFGCHPFLLLIAFVFASLRTIAF